MEILKIEQQSPQRAVGPVIVIVKSVKMYFRSVLNFITFFQNLTLQRKIYLFIVKKIVFSVGFWVH